MRLQAWGLMLLLAGLSGCQCCGLTERYASAIDCISDHEHTFERFYSPGWDLNRIGRRDWCSYRKNQLLCGCACNRVRPAPCEYCVCRETGVVLPGHQVRHPDWTEDAPNEPPTQEPQLEEPAPSPPGIPDLDTPLIEEGEQDLKLP